eukprot:TRINITY_DN4380_c0_g2_i1.p1 TRINITY_DN4380_c0_g2~~TRINITY_DN4380_c0_g2_i1.p1  ORF type:complete len:2979 (-),score=729.92 TRINITY_DN4380_c0_g2_i1:148-9084(-)
MAAINAAIELLKQISLQDETQREPKIKAINVINNDLQQQKNNKLFSQLVSSSVSVLIKMLSDADMNIWSLAKEALNKIIKVNLKNHNERIISELFKGMKASKQQGRSQRVSIELFATVCHAIHPQKCKKHVASLIMIIENILTKDDVLLLETLGIQFEPIAMHMISYFTDDEIRSLLKSFIHNLRSDMGAIRRASTSAIVSILRHCSSPFIMFVFTAENLKKVHLTTESKKDEKKEEEEEVEKKEIVSTTDSDTNNTDKNESNTTTTNEALASSQSLPSIPKFIVSNPLQGELYCLLQLFKLSAEIQNREKYSVNPMLAELIYSADLCWFSIRHTDNNVVVSSFELLQELFSSYWFYLSDLWESQPASKIIVEGLDEFIKDPNYQVLKMNGKEQDDPASNHTKMSLLLKYFKWVLLETPNDANRISSKTLILTCCTKIVSTHVHGYKQFSNWSDDEVFSLLSISDPTLRGQACLFIGSLISSRCNELTNTIDESQSLEHNNNIPTWVQRLINLLETEKSSVTAKMLCEGLVSCWQPLLNSYYAFYALFVIKRLLQLIGMQSYRLLKVELLDFIGSIDYTLLNFIERCAHDPTIKTRRDAFAYCPDFDQGLGCGQLQKLCVDKVIAFLSDNDNQVRASAAENLANLIIVTDYVGYWKKDSQWSGNISVSLASYIPKSYHSLQCLSSSEDRSVFFSDWNGITLDNSNIESQQKSTNVSAAIISDESNKTDIGKRYDIDFQQCYFKKPVRTTLFHWLINELMEFSNKNQDSRLLKGIYRAFRHLVVDEYELPVNSILPLLLDQVESIPACLDLETQYDLLILMGHVVAHLTRDLTRYAQRIYLHFLRVLYIVSGILKNQTRPQYKEPKQSNSNQNQNIVESTLESIQTSPQYLKLWDRLVDAHRVGRTTFTDSDIYHSIQCVAFQGLSQCIVTLNKQIVSMYATEILGYITTNLDDQPMATVDCLKNLFIAVFNPKTTHTAEIVNNSPSLLYEMLSTDKQSSVSASAPFEKNEFGLNDFLFPPSHHPLFLNQIKDLHLHSATTTGSTSSSSPSKVTPDSFKMNTNIADYSWKSTHGSGWLQIVRDLFARASPKEMTITLNAGNKRQILKQFEPVIAAVLLKYQNTQKLQVQQSILSLLTTLVKFEVEFVGLDADNSFFIYLVNQLTTHKLSPLVPAQLNLLTILHLEKIHKHELLTPSTYASLVNAPFIGWNSICSTQFMSSSVSFLQTVFNPFLPSKNTTIDRSVYITARQYTITNLLNKLPHPNATQLLLHVLDMIDNTSESDNPHSEPKNGGAVPLPAKYSVGEKEDYYKQILDGIIQLITDYGRLVGITTHDLLGLFRLVDRMPKEGLSAKVIVNLLDTLISMAPSKTNTFDLSFEAFPLDISRTLQEEVYKKSNLHWIPSTIIILRLFFKLECDDILNFCVNSKTYVPSMSSNPLSDDSKSASMAAFFLKILSLCSSLKDCSYSKNLSRMICILVDSIAVLLSQYFSQSVSIQLAELLQDSKKDLWSDFYVTASGYQSCIGFSLIRLILQIYSSRNYNTNFISLMTHEKNSMKTWHHLMLKYSSYLAITRSSYALPDLDLNQLIRGLFTIIHERTVQKYIQNLCVVDDKFLHCIIDFIFSMSGLSKPHQQQEEEVGDKEVDKKDDVGVNDVGDVDRSDKKDVVIYEEKTELNSNELHSLLTLTACVPFEKSTQLMMIIYQHFLSSHYVSVRISCEDVILNILHQIKKTHRFGIEPEDLENKERKTHTNVLSTLKDFIQNHRNLFRKSFIKNIVESNLLQLEHVTSEGQMTLSSLDPIPTDLLDKKLNTWVSQYIKNTSKSSKKLTQTMYLLSVNLFNHQHTDAICDILLHLNKSFGLRDHLHITNLLVLTLKKNSNTNNNHPSHTKLLKDIILPVTTGLETLKTIKSSSLSSSSSTSKLDSNHKQQIFTLLKNLPILTHVLKSTRQEIQDSLIDINDTVDINNTDNINKNDSEYGPNSIFQQLEIPPFDRLMSSCTQLLQIIRNWMKNQKPITSLNILNNLLQLILSMFTCVPNDPNTNSIIVTNTKILASDLYDTYCILYNPTFSQNQKSDEDDDINNKNDKNVKSKEEFMLFEKKLNNLWKLLKVTRVNHVSESEEISGVNDQSLALLKDDKIQNYSLHQTFIDIFWDISRILKKDDVIFPYQDQIINFDNNDDPIGTLLTFSLLIKNKQNEFDTQTFNRIWKQMISIIRISEDDDDQDHFATTNNLKCIALRNILTLLSKCISSSMISSPPVRRRSSSATKRDSIYKDIVVLTDTKTEQDKATNPPPVDSNQTTSKPEDTVTTTPSTSEKNDADTSKVEQVKSVESGEQSQPEQVDTTTTSSTQVGDTEASKPVNDQTNNTTITTTITTADNDNNINNDKGVESMIIKSETETDDVVKKEVVVGEGDDDQQHTTKPSSPRSSEAIVDTSTTITTTTIEELPSVVPEKVASLLWLISEHINNYMTNKHHTDYSIQQESIKCVVKLIDYLPLNWLEWSAKTLHCLSNFLNDSYDDPLIRMYITIGIAKVESRIYQQQRYLGIPVIGDEVGASSEYTPSSPMFWLPIEDRSPPEITVTMDSNTITRLSLLGSLIATNIQDAEFQIKEQQLPSGIQPTLNMEQQLASLEAILLLSESKHIHTTMVTSSPIISNWLVSLQTEYFMSSHSLLWTKKFKTINTIVFSSSPPPKKNNPLPLFQAVGKTISTNTSATTPQKSGPPPPVSPFPKKWMDKVQNRTKPEQSEPQTNEEETKHMAESDILTENMATIKELFDKIRQSPATDRSLYVSKLSELFSSKISFNQTCALVFGELTRPNDNVYTIVEVLYNVSGGSEIKFPKPENVERIIHWISMCFENIAQLVQLKYKQALYTITILMIITTQLPIQQRLVKDLLYGEIKDTNGSSSSTDEPDDKKILNDLFVYVGIRFAQNLQEKDRNEFDRVLKKLNQIEPYNYLISKISNIPPRTTTTTSPSNTTKE